MSLGVLLIAPNVRRLLCMWLVIIDILAVVVGIVWIATGILLCSVAWVYRYLKVDNDQYVYSILFSGIFSTVLHAFAAWCHLGASDWRQLFMHQKFFSAALFLNVFFKFVHLIVAFVYGTMLSYTESYLEENYRAGIKKRMEEYSMNRDYRMQINDVQQKFRCCGGKNYKDWFDIGWFRAEYLTVSLPEKKKQEYIRHDYFYGSPVPFSCCDVKATRPCVYIFTREDNMVFNYHHRNDLTLYQEGCGRMMGHEIGWFVEFFGNFLIYSLVVQIFNLLLSRFVQTAIQTGTDHGDPTQTAYGYILSFGVPLRPPGALSEYEGSKQRNELMLDMVMQAEDMDALTDVKMAELDRFTMEAAYEERKAIRAKEKLANNNATSSNNQRRLKHVKQNILRLHAYGTKHTRHKHRLKNNIPLWKPASAFDSRAIQIIKPLLKTAPKVHKNSRVTR